MIHPGTRCPALLIPSEVIWGSNTLHTLHYSLRTPPPNRRCLISGGCTLNHIRGLLVATGLPYSNRISRSFKVHRHQCDPNNLPIASGCVDETCMQNAGTAEQLCSFHAGSFPRCSGASLCSCLPLVVNFLLHTCCVSPMLSPPCLLSGCREHPALTGHPQTLVITGLMWRSQSLPSSPPLAAASVTLECLCSLSSLPSARV